jgi:hypothetical protein
MRAIFFVAICAACGSSNSGGELVSIRVEPANATITVENSPVTLDYTAIGVFGDGHEEPLPNAVFTLDGDGMLLGDFTSAQFEAHGQAAGKGGVVATLGDANGVTSVIVAVHPVRLGDGVPPGAAGNFGETSPTGAFSQTVVYPLDGAVMPTSVKSPHVQWEGMTTSDELYRVRLTAGFATVDTILAASSAGFDFASQLSAADWRLIVTAGGSISVSVDHWDPTNGAHGGAPVFVKIITADITGAIYYWNLVQGQMERIDAAGRAVAIPAPPPSPSGSRCVACHTVSRDGRFLAGAIGDAGGQAAVFDMSDPAVRTADPAPTLTPVTSTSYRALFSTFNEDASRLVLNADNALTLIDPRNGTSVAVNGTPLPAVRASHPAWSPDGTSIVFVNNIRNGADTTTWAVDYTHGDLQIIPTSANDTFGAPVNLVTSGDPAFTAPSWPSFAPDSKWIAYGAGAFSRGKSGPTEHPGSLFVVDKAVGTPQRLDIACGGARRCYLPNFSPYDAGGYFWLVYYSFRDYGNVQAGTKNTGRRQMWITAIDKAKLASGGDPSSVPYWVPDQDRLTENMSAFWAPPAPLQ